MKSKFALKLTMGASAILLAACGTTTTSSSSGTSSSSQGSSASAKNIKVFVIPKQLGNSYFTTADSVKSGGALAAIQQLGATGTETSGSASTPSSQLPVIQSAITQGAKALVVSATDPTALCPTLNSAMAKGIAVVTYDSDAPHVERYL